MEEKSKYGAESIKVLEGLDAVRKRPAMYIGDTGKKGLNHLLFEVIDNSVDEALAGFCKNIEVVIKKDGSAMVRDDGRGIPTEVHPEYKISALEIVITKLHAGGKFEKGAYTVSGGLHGVGVSVVNALSEWMEVEVHRNGKIYRQQYKRGNPASPVETIGDTTYSGTIVRFKPDPLVFREVDFDYELVRERLRELSFLNKGLRIVFKDERSGVEEEFLHNGGIEEFVVELNKAKAALHRPVYFQKEVDGCVVEYAIQYNDGYYETVYSFANDIRTEEGGTHLSGFRTAVTRAINDYIKENEMLKGEEKVSGDDVKEGLAAVLSVRLPEPQFEGQTKTKLGNSEMKGFVDSVVYDTLKTWMLEHPEDAKKIALKCINAMEAREAAKKAKEMIRRKGVFETSVLPGKLADCIEQNPEKAELFIVEGDSAGGSSKQGRDRQTQAILPLKGKILNVEKAPIHKIVKSEEIKNIILALGCGFEDDFDVSKLRYHKIIIMSVDYDEPTVIMDPNGFIKICKIGEFIDSHINCKEINRYKVLCFDIKTNKTTFKPIKKIIRHKITEPLFEITTAYGKKIRVTASHSLFTYKDGKIKLKKTSEFKKGDLIVAPMSLPLFKDGGGAEKSEKELDLLEEFLKIKDKLDVDVFVRGTPISSIWKKRVLAKHQKNPCLTEDRVEISSELMEEMRRARIEKGFSQKHVCDATGIKQPATFYSWERGASKPTLTHFKKYTTLLGFDEEQINSGFRIIPSKLEHIWNISFKNSGCNIVKDYIRVKEIKDEEMYALANADVYLSPTHYAHKSVKRFIPIDEGLMFVLGFFVAEGSCSQRNGVRFAIGNNNMKVASNLKSLLEKIFGTEAKFYASKGGGGEIKILNSVVSATFRHVFGFDKVDSSSKRIPSIVFNSPKALQAAFLKGYLFGDGTISKNGIHFSTSSKELANDLLYLLLANGVIASTSVCEPPKKSTIIRGKPVVTKLKSYRISITDKESLLALKSIWKDHHLAYHLKNKMKSNYKSGYNRKFIRVSGDLIALPIISIKKVQPTKKAVYDFSVEGDENFIAGFGALCAHNTDADVDGSHIRTLLLTLFYRYMKQIIEKGYLYIAQPPLYRVKKGKIIRYAYSDEELGKIISEIGEADIQRYKGLGEMNPEQLWETTMNPETRTLKKVTIEDAAIADQLFSILMGENVEPRREFIEKYATEVKQLDV